jgi:hypothetical protein
MPNAERHLKLRWGLHGSGETEGTAVAAARDQSSAALIMQSMMMLGGMPL